MRNFLLTAILSCFIIAAQAQRTSVDSAILTCTFSQGSSSTNFLDILPADKDKFWTIYTKDQIGVGTGHSSWHGNIRIEKRDTATLQITDSMTMEGNGALLETEVDLAGNLYVLCYVKDSLHINDTTRIGAGRHFLAKFKTDMSLEFVNDTIAGDRLGVSPDGDFIYISGDLKGFGNTTNIYKLAPTGEQVDSKALSGIGYIGDVVTNNNGTVYFTGACLSNFAQLDTVDASHGYNYTTYYGRLDDNLVAEWIRIFEDVTCPSPWLDIDNNENLLYYAPLYKTNIIGQDTFASNGDEFLFTSTEPSGNINYAVDAPGVGKKVSVLSNEGKGLTTYSNLAALLLVHKGNADTIQWGDTVSTTTNIWTGRSILLEYDINTGKAVNASYPPYPYYTRYTSLMYLDNGDMLVASTTGSDTMMIRKLRVPKAPTTGITQSSTNDFKAYPNPTDGTVRFTKAISGSVYNITGSRVVMINEATTLDLSKQPSGVYYIRTNNGATVKLVKR